MRPRGADDIAAWAARYVGLPFRPLGRDRSGVDCWGLVRLVYAEQLGIALPAYVAGYGEVSRAEAAAIAGLVHEGMASWREVPAAAAVPGDAVLLRVWGRPVHIGVLAGRGVMLHVDEGIDATIERLDGARWARRLLGYYRHREAAYA